MGSRGKEGGLFGLGFCFFVLIFLGFFVWFLLFLPFQKGINSTSRGRKKSCYQTAEKGESFSFPCVLPTSSPPVLLSFLMAFTVFHFGLFSGIPLSPFVLPARFLIGPSCPL